MTAHIATFAFTGIEATAVDVQVQITSGLPAFVLVGLPDKAVGESRERVRSAIGAMGLALPAKRIVINLAPADLAKEGSHFDLPIALGLLTAMGILPEEEIQAYAALGELSLDGAILPVAGVLPAALAASARGLGVVCPSANGQEAAWAGAQTPVLAPASLLALVNHFKGFQALTRPRPQTAAAETPARDMRQIKGQQTARRALEIAAAGGHNLLMIGPPGAGKSLLASCLPGILPPMTAEEMLETSLIASVAGKLVEGRITPRRPFRDPHHTASSPAMVGGGKRALPGEISLAHHGVLFLDELPEFPRAVLESLRQPMETGTISVARVQSHVTYPARFQLIAAMNPCRCGYLADPARACAKAPRCGADYQSKISGPLYDRIDLHLEMPPVDTLSMLDARADGEPSADVAARVARARERQRARAGAKAAPGMHLNARLEGERLMELATPEEAGMHLLRQATERFGLSMRSFHRVLRVARTIADLAGSERVAKAHVAEALQFRLPTHAAPREIAPAIGA